MRLVYLLVIVLIVSSCNTKVENLQLSEEANILALIEAFESLNTPINFEEVENVFVGQDTLFVADYAIEDGDSIKFDYIASYMNSNTTLNLFDTNIKHLVIDSDGNEFEASFPEEHYLKRECISGEEKFIEGLNNGLKYVNAGNEFIIIVPFHYGYNDQLIGIVPEYSTLFYEIFNIEHTSDNIKKEQQEIENYIDDSFINYPARGFNKRIDVVGNGTFPKLNDIVSVNFSYKKLDGTVIVPKQELGNVDIVVNFDAEKYNDALYYALLVSDIESENEFTIPSYMLNKGFDGIDLNKYESLVLELDIYSIK